MLTFPIATSVIDFSVFKFDKIFSIYQDNCSEGDYLKVNGYIFRGSNSAILIFASLFSEISSLWKDFAPQKANSFLSISVFASLFSENSSLWKDFAPQKANSFL